MCERDNIGSDEILVLLEENDLEQVDDLCDVMSEHESDAESNVSVVDFQDDSDVEDNDSPGNETRSIEDDLLNNGGGDNNLVSDKDVNDSWVEWKEGDASFGEFKYVLNSGFKPPTGQKPTSALDYFQLFFTDELLTEIVNETNRYAGEKIQMNTPLRKKSMWKTWRNVTLPEMKAFIGCFLNMAMNNKPEVEDYFSSDWLDFQPFFKDIFSKERFLQIFWNLHICPPPSGPVAGTLSRSGKVRNVVLYLDRKFREYYVPKNKVSVDESTVGFKGKILFKVYNKDKPIKWGVKIYVLSESDTGYICSLEPYFGQITTQRLARPELLVTTRIVLHLVNKLKQSYGSVEGLHVFTDRYYTSMELAEELCALKVHLTGTILRNRKRLPEQFRAKKKVKRLTNPKGQPSGHAVTPLILNKGDIKAFRNNDRYSLVLWKDKNEVSLLSTLYDNSTQTVRRLVKGGVMEEVVKPKVVCKYNESMGGVDISDHFISSYGFVRKSLKWWRKVFFWLIETAVVNSFLLFNMNEAQGKMRHRQFRKSLIKQLVGDTRNNNKRGRPSQSTDAGRQNGKLHLPYPMEPRKTKDCVVCSDQSRGGVRKRTKHYCKTCENQPGLHIGLCFEKYHSLMNFRD